MVGSGEISLTGPVGTLAEILFENVLKFDIFNLLSLMSKWEFYILIDTYNIGYLGTMFGYMLL